MNRGFVILENCAMVFALMVTFVQSWKDSAHGASNGYGGESSESGPNPIEDGIGYRGYKEESTEPDGHAPGRRMYWNMTPDVTLLLFVLFVMFLRFFAGIFTKIIVYVKKLTSEKKPVTRRGVIKTFQKLAQIPEVYDNIKLDNASVEFEEKLGEILSKPENVSKFQAIVNVNCAEPLLVNLMILLNSLEDENKKIMIKSLGSIPNLADPFMDRFGLPGLLANFPDLFTEVLNTTITENFEKAKTMMNILMNSEEEKTKKAMLDDLSGRYCDNTYPRVKIPFLLCLMATNLEDTANPFMKIVADSSISPPFFLADLLGKAQTEVEETKLINLLPTMSTQYQNLKPITKMIDYLFTYTRYAALKERCEGLMKKVVEVLMSESNDEKLQRNKNMLKTELSGRHEDV
eukprot:887187_1